MAGLVGTLSSRPRYVEAAVAGGASGALALFVGAMGLSVVTGGMVPVAGAAVGALAAVGGFYAGRDLRDGVTRICSPRRRRSGAGQSHRRQVSPDCSTIPSPASHPGPPRRTLDGPRRRG